MRKKAQALKNTLNGKKSKNKQSTRKKSETGKTIQKKSKVSKGKRNNVKKQHAQLVPSSKNASKKKQMKHSKNILPRDSANSLAWNIDEDMMKDFAFDIDFEAESIHLQSPSNFSCIPADFLTSPGMIISPRAVNGGGSPGNCSGD